MEEYPKWEYTLRYPDRFAEKQRSVSVEGEAYFEGRFVIQLFEEGILLDERIVSVKAGTPCLISCVADIQ